MLELARVEVGALRIGFRQRFTHSLASRDAMASLWCRLEDDAGRVGWGEGCPRSYVTGEELDLSVDRLRALGPALVGLRVAGLDDIRELLDGEIPADAPSIRCALELALLDLLGRHQERSVADMLGARRGRVRYSGVISSERPEVVEALAERGKDIGFADYKLKVGADLQRNLATLAALRRVVGPKPCVRVDANAAWSLDDGAEQIAALVDAGVTVFEQPLPAAGAPGRRALRELRTRIPEAAEIMVDESLVSPADLEAFVTEGGADRLLLKVSKQGGPLRTLAFARRAAEAGIVSHLGNHVGESSLLSAAGRVVAGAHDFASVEGSFGLLLLREDVVAEPLQFGAGGWAPIRYAQGPGWGLEIRLPKGC